MTACAVLHVESIPGGGVDRHVRDIARDPRRRHLVWHTGDDADVLEDPARQRFLPLDRAALDRDPAALARWLREQGVGVVHAHSVSREVRRRASWAAGALDAPHFATLHDVLFLRRDGFEPRAERSPQAAWVGEVAPFLKTAAAVLAPSEYIAGLARQHVGVVPHVVPNGLATPRPSGTAAAHEDFLQRKPARVVAALGAIGPHKGSRALEAFAATLGHEGIAVVVVGYTDRQVWPGWYSDNLFIHGPYLEEDAGALLAAYGARLVVFPNAVPESFSYALSDAWHAGFPVLVPPEGALGDRVREHGGGWVLPGEFEPGEAALRVVDLLAGGGEPSLADVESSLRARDDARIPTLPAMQDALDALYERHGLVPGAAVDVESPALQSLLATHLDSGVFRRELIWLSGEVGRLRAGPDEERRAARQFEVEAREWMAKLERDVEALQAQLRDEAARRERAEALALAEGLRRQALERATFVGRLKYWMSPFVPEAVKRLLRKRPDARG